jgi:hypothetical protein
MTSTEPTSMKIAGMEHYGIGPTAPPSEPWSAGDATQCVANRPDAGGATADKETKVLNAGLTLVAGLPCKSLGRTRRLPARQ